MSTLKDSFPIFKNNPDLFYLDTAATAQKPNCVLDTIDNFYKKENANIHRGVYKLSYRATEAYEKSRTKVAEFLGDRTNTGDIVFLKGATEALNFLANSFLSPNLHSGDEVLITQMEHHANIVPWYLVCKASGAKLLVAEVLDNGELDLQNLKSLITSKTKLISLVHVSNTLGSINPIRKIIKFCKENRDIPIIIDGSQALMHRAIDVTDLGCDFYVFSGHKAYGPTGIGALWGKKELLEKMPPWQGGGDMIANVTFEKISWKESPHRFEAGTPNIVGAMGLSSALDFIEEVGFDEISRIETKLLEEATQLLESFPEISIIGRSPHKTGIISFVMKRAHPHDIGTIFDQENIAIRTGHHCTQPLMQRFSVPATARISFGLYNDIKDVEHLDIALKKVVKIFK